jgi:predicted Zn-dependent peptidase
VLAAPAGAMSVEQFEKNLTVHKLDNGLTLLIYERPVAPVVSFFTLVNVGSAQEVPGITGLAHMFEHMAFKGTTKIGTSNHKTEIKALEAVDAAYAAWDAERRKPGGADPEKLAELKQALEEIQDEASELVVKNEFADIIERAGGPDLNAMTGADITGYMYSLPANKIELWAYLESERFLDPVFREFYKERDVIMEERRMRTDSRPIGRLIEQLLVTAYTAHPYGHPGIGYMSDLESFTREDGHAFYAVHYVPANMTVAVVGDVKADEVLPMLEKYFSRLPKRPPPPPVRTVEPEQIAEKTIRIHDPSQPIYLEAYHRPAATHEDDAVYDAISDILSDGRTSRLHRRLVRDEKIAAFAAAVNGMPGDKYPTLMMFIGVTTPGHTNEEIQAAIAEEIERLKTEPVPEEELRKVKTNAKANLIRGLANNMGIAMQLAMFQAQYGDWRELFEGVEAIEKVSAGDIMRVANATFKPNNRTVAMIVNEAEADAEEEAQ